MFILLQKILPKQVLSRLLGYLANWQWVPFKNWVIRLFIRHFKVDMADYLSQDAADFKSFNDFFIRSLRPEARPIPTDAHAMISSVDGCVSQLGQIQNTQLIPCAAIGLTENKRPGT